MILQIILQLEVGLWMQRIKLRGGILSKRRNKRKNNNKKNKINLEPLIKYINKTFMLLFHKSLSSQKIIIKKL